jgi:hypothetical protein
MPDVLKGPSDEDFTPETARFLTCLTFSDRAQRRLGELLEKNREGRLDPAEAEELDQFVKANTRLATLQSKARLFLKRAGFEP